MMFRYVQNDSIDMQWTRELFKVCPEQNLVIIKTRHKIIVRNTMLQYCIDKN